jgi:hypothetical protein
MSGIRLNYAIAREVGITPYTNFGVYYPQPRYHAQMLLVPSNQMLKPILKDYFAKSKWNPARP